MEERGNAFEGSAARERKTGTPRDAACAGKRRTSGESIGPCQFLGWLRSRTVLVPRGFSRFSFSSRWSSRASLSLFISLRLSSALSVSWFISYPSKVYPRRAGLRGVASCSERKPTQEAENETARNEEESERVEPGEARERGREREREGEREKNRRENVTRTFHENVRDRR